MTTFTKTLIEDGSVTIDYQINKELPGRKLMISINGDRINLHASCIGNKRIVVENQFANDINLIIKE